MGSNVCCNLSCHRTPFSPVCASFIIHKTFHHIAANRQKVSVSIKFPKAFIDMQGHQKANTHLPPAFAGALTLVSGPEAEAAGTAMRVGVVKIEGTFPTGIAPDTSYVSLQTWQP